MGSSDIEICSNCGREIGRSEQAYVFEVKIVCAQCDKKLRSASGDRAKVVSYRGQTVKSLVLGILGICSFLLGVILTIASSGLLGLTGSMLMVLTAPILGVIGLSLGSVAKRGMRVSGNEKFKGMATAGIVLGIIAVSFGGLIALVSSAIWAGYVPPGEQFNLWSFLLYAILNPAVILLLWVCTTLWVGIDSYDLMRNISGVERKQIDVVVRSSVMWVVGCVLLWIVVFPWYLLKRQKYIAFQRNNLVKLELERQKEGRQRDADYKP